jgi:hypothetical protein
MPSVWKSSALVKIFRRILQHFQFGTTGTDDAFCTSRFFTWLISFCLQLTSLFENGLFWYFKFSPVHQFATRPVDKTRQIWGVLICSFQPGSNFEITVLAIKFVIGMLLLYGVGVVVKACQSASRARFGTESCSEDSVRNENSRVQSHPPRRRRRDRRYDDGLDVYDLAWNSRDAGRLRGLCPAFRGQADLHLASSRPAQTVDESPRSETEISPPHDSENWL